MEKICLRMLLSKIKKIGLPNLRINFERTGTKLFFKKLVANFFTPSPHDKQLQEGNKISNLLQNNRLWSRKISLEVEHQKSAQICDAEPVSVPTRTC